MAYVFLMITFAGIIIGLFKIAKKKRMMNRKIILTVFLGIICLTIFVCAVICCF